MNNMTDETMNFEGKQVVYDSAYESGKKVIGLGEALIREDGALRHKAPAAPAVTPALEPTAVPLEPATPAPAPEPAAVPAESATPVEEGPAPVLEDPMKQETVPSNNQFVPPVGALPEETDAYAEAQKFMNEGEEVHASGSAETMEPAAVPVTEPAPVPEIKPESQTAPLEEITSSVADNNTDFAESVTPVEEHSKPEIISIDRSILDDFVTQLEGVKEQNIEQNNKIDHIVASISKAMEDGKNITPVIEEAAATLNTAEPELPPMPEEVPTLGSEELPPALGDNVAPVEEALPPMSDASVPAMDALGAPSAEPVVPAAEAGLPPVLETNNAPTEDVVPPVFGPAPTPGDLPPFPVEENKSQPEVNTQLAGMGTPPAPGYTQPFAM